MQGQYIPTGDLYEAVTDDNALNALPSMIAGIVGGRSCVMQRMTGNAAKDVFGFCYYSKDMMDDYRSRFTREDDIWLADGVQSGIVNRAILTDERVSLGRYKASKLWNDFHVPHGDDTGRSIGAVHHYGGGVLATAIHRPISAKPFGAVEEAALNSLLNDLHRILRMRQMLDRKNDQLQTVTEMLSATGQAVVMLTSGMRIISASQAAMAIFSRADGIALRGSELSFADGAIGMAIREAVAATIDRRPLVQSAFLCARPSYAAPYRLMLLPCQHEGQSACILLIDDSEDESELHWSWITQCYRLTPSEKFVAMQLVAGLSPDDIAEKRGVSIETVRSHIRSLLSKTGTRRQSAMTALLARLPQAR